MKRETLSTLDLDEKPGQRITWVRRVQHRQVDGPLELRPGERPFAAGAHHSAYVCMVEREEQPAAAMVQGEAARRIRPVRTAKGQSERGALGAFSSVQFDRSQKTPRSEFIQSGPIKQP